EGTIDLSAFTPGEQKVLRKALARDPNQRHPSCRAFIKALADANNPSAAQDVGRIDNPSHPRRSGSHWNRTLPLLLLGVVLAALAAWAVYYFFFHTPRTTQAPKRLLLPEGFEARGEAAGGDYPPGIVYKGLQGAGPLEFLLIRRHNPGTDPPTFYLMKHKVT